MSSFSISDAVVSCQLASEESLTSSQLTLSCTLQSFFTEATSCSALFSLAVGQGFAAVVQAQGFRLLSPLFNPKMSRILSTSASWITEGVAFNTASELGRSGEFRIGPLTENIHGIATIAVCKVMGKGILAHNAMVRNLVQNSALMTVDVTFEECGFVEKRNFSLTERFFNCQLTSWRMEISASFLTTACPQISIFKAEQELDYELRKPTLHQRGSEGKKRFFDPLQEMLAPALAGNNGKIIASAEFERVNGFSSKENRAPILMMTSHNENGSFSGSFPSLRGVNTGETTPLSGETIAQLHGFIRESGLDPDSQMGQAALGVLSHRISLGEDISQLTTELAKSGKAHLTKILKDLPEQDLAFLLISCATEANHEKVSSHQWRKLLMQGEALFANSNEIEFKRSIQLSEDYTTPEYKPEIEKAKAALIRVNILRSIFSKISLTNELFDGTVALFYRTLSGDIRTIHSFQKIFTAWNADFEWKVVPLLERIKSPCNDPRFWIPKSFDDEQTWQEGSSRAPEEELKVETSFTYSQLDANPQKRIQGASVLIQLSRERGMERKSIDSFHKIFSEQFSHQFDRFELVRKETENPFFQITHQGIHFSVKIVVAEKQSSSNTEGIEVFPEAVTVETPRISSDQVDDTIPEKRISEDPQRLSRRFNRTADYLWLGASCLASPVTGQAAIFGWLLSQLRIPTAVAALASGAVTEAVWYYHQGNPHPIATTALFTGLASLYALVRGRMLIKESRGNPHPFKSRPNKEIPQLVPLPAEVVDAEIAQESLKTRPGIITIDGEPDPVDGFPKAFTWVISTQGKGFSRGLKTFYTAVDPIRSSVSIGHLSQMPGTGLLFYPFAWGAGIDLRGFQPRNGKKVYYSWDAGFTRERRDNFRFMEGSAPSDGKVIYIGRGTLDQVIQIKGHTTTVKEFLGEEASQHFSPNQEVIVVVTYLSPKDLHLGYAPSDGELLVNQQIPGKAYTVGTEIWDESEVEGQPGARYLAWQNRYITAYQTKDGIIAEGYVAATYVNDAEVYPKPGEEVKAGQHVQTYHYGSTNVSIRSASDFAIPHNLAVGVNLTKGKTPFLIPRRVLRREI